MNLYLLTQDSNNGYDTFDSCIVAAETEEEARLTHPNDYYIYRDWCWRYPTGDWGEVFNNEWVSPDNVKVKLIGKATEGTKKWVILSSFNAG